MNSSLGRLFKSSNSFFMFIWCFVKYWDQYDMKQFFPCWFLVIFTKTSILTTLVTSFIFSLFISTCISAMKKELNRNYSEVTEFILLGFRTPPKLQILLFLIFLLIYLVTVVGNISMIIVIKMDSRLQTPMYFFLRNLSYLDLCYSTVISLKTLANFLTNEKKISYNGCATQFFFFALFVTTEAFLWLSWHTIDSLPFAPLSFTLCTCARKSVFGW